MSDIGYGYLTSIERGVSIPSTEVVMRLALALDTTPDEFLVGTSRHTSTVPSRHLLLLHVPPPDYQRRHR